MKTSLDLFIVYENISWRQMTFSPKPPALSVQLFPEHRPLEIT